MLLSFTPATVLAIKGMCFQTSHTHSHTYTHPQHISTGKFCVIRVILLIVGGMKKKRNCVRKKLQGIARSTCVCTDPHNQHNGPYQLTTRTTTNYRQGTMPARHFAINVNYCQPGSQYAKERTNTGRTMGIMANVCRNWTSSGIFRNFEMYLHSYWQWLPTRKLHIHVRNDNIEHRVKGRKICVAKCSSRNASLLLVYANFT